MKKLLFILFICICFNVLETNAQKVYRNNSSMYSDIIWNVENNCGDYYIYYGNSTLRSDINSIFDGKYFYNGSIKQHSNIVYTWYNNQLYKGKSTYISDIICTYKSGSFYFRNNITQSYLMYTYRNNKVYLKNSSMESNILIKTSDELPPAILAYILF